MMKSRIARTSALFAMAALLAAGLVMPGPASAQTQPGEAATAPAVEQHAGEPAPHADPVPPAGADAGAHGAGAPSHAGAEHRPEAPNLAAAIPFVVVLLCIAILPLIPSVAHWWHHNSNKFIVSLVLAAVALGYYFLRGTGFGHGEHAAGPGFPTVLKVIQHAVVDEYIPFMVLLFSLYTICGGIILRGDLRAKPATNATFLAAGSLLASFVGTTGASMLLIRPLLQTNKERKYVVHTVVFFIFLVSNIGGSLLPVGDPPLFLGYLRGVPFLWTLGLWPEWLFCVGVLLGLYFVVDTYFYRKEPPLAQALDRTQIEPLKVNGALNFVWLLGVVLSVALFVPGEPLLGRFFVVPNHLREFILLALVGLAWVTSSPKIRRDNEFNFGAIIEVAVLFIGIFITMQAPIEILQIKGPNLGLDSPAKFFWATGTLSSFLDNAPTYVVFFSTANAMTHAAGPGIIQLVTGDFIRTDLLVAISLGAVFMGANTYIGNGPNFMVKSIAESSGVRMPSFFGYMLYSVGILVPLFFVVMFIFLM